MSVYSSGYFEGLFYVVLVEFRGELGVFLEKVFGRSIGVEVREFELFI